jgi:hypothetical protein
MSSAAARLMASRVRRFSFMRPKTVYWSASLDEIVNGCQTPYQLNYDNWDHDTATPKPWADITCSSYGSGDLPPVTPTRPRQDLARHAGDRREMTCRRR